MDDDTVAVEAHGQVGICGLCHERRQLRDSHLLPAGVYRLLREPERPNPNPVVVTAEIAGTTSRQVTAYFLCQDCEQRFSRQGEQYVIGQCARRDRFPLRDALLASRPAFVVPPQVPVYEVSALLGERIEDYLYFAASIFWRRAARTWDDGMSEFSLGALYEEQFRLYLLGAEWPRNARLVVHVSTDERTDYVIPPTVGPRTGAVRRYKFYIPGILFILFVGATVSRDDDRGALNSSAGHFMWLRPFEQDSLFKGLVSVGRKAIRNPRTLRPPTART